MKKTNILVVDDSPAIRKSLVNLLEPLDVNIIEAENGSIGLNHAIN
ncbi:MAG: response regulator, partial [Deltaproteobacteria bacterium]